MRIINIIFFYLNTPKQLSLLLTNVTETLSRLECAEEKIFVIS